MPKRIIMIPSRYGSSRLEGKPLMDISGKSLVARVTEQALKSVGWDRVCVVTDHPDIRDEAKKVDGIYVIETDPQAKSGTDRCAQASVLLHLESEDWVINVQGDMPFVDPMMITELINATHDAPYNVLTPVMRRFEIVGGMVQVLVGHAERAILFSRAFPMGKQMHDAEGRPVYYNHVGMYAYRVGALRTFWKAEQPAIEKSESLEQLRFIHYNIPVGVVISAYDCGPEVNTIGDLHYARKFAES